MLTNVSFPLLESVNGVLNFWVQLRIPLESSAFLLSWLGFEDRLVCDPNWRLHLHFCFWLG